MKIQTWVYADTGLPLTIVLLTQGVRRSDVEQEVAIVEVVLAPGM